MSSFDPNPSTVISTAEDQPRELDRANPENAMFTPIADITGARRAIRKYLDHADGQLPDDTYEKLADLADSPSPVDQIAQTAELLYARHGQLDDAGRTITGQLASFAAINGFHGMWVDNRGGRIAQAMEREMGFKATEAMPEPARASDDPQPLVQFRIETADAQPATGAPAAA
jgi:hypothetical protein